MKATCILITKDPEYPKEVIDSLVKKFDEVLIETNCPSIFRRYELALKAKHDLIYVQDDDCLVDVIALYRAYNGQLTNAITEHHLRTYKDTGVTLIGFGAFFPKSMVNFDRYLNKYGINDLFLSQTDRVFTYLNQPHNSVVTDIINLPRATDDTRMSTQPDHWENLNQIKKQLCVL